jgi:hypothetical protein
MMNCIHSSKGDHFAELDAYIRAHAGADQFHRILQQFFLFRYFVEDRISRKQMQTALGIQQVRWASDPENCHSIIKGSFSFVVRDTLFYYWEDIPPARQAMIAHELHKQIKERLLQGETITEETLPEVLRRTIWYSVSTESKYNGLLGSWAGYAKPDLSRDLDSSEPLCYYALPVTYQHLTKHYCIYAPELLFGSLSSPSLTKHMILNQTRPYNCHLPNSRSNLCSVHGNAQHILQIWFHDFHHARSGGCSLAYRFHPLQSLLKQRLTQENIKALLADPTSELSQLMEVEKAKEASKQYSLFQSLNDTGSLWTEQPPDFLGELNRKALRKSKRRLRSTRRQQEYNIKTKYGTKSKKDRLNQVRRNSIHFKKP